MKSAVYTYSSAIETAHNYSRWVLEAFTPYMGNSLLEVGLGHGGYRQHFPANINYTGVDIDAAAIKNAKARYPDDRFEVADVSDLKSLRVLSEKGYDSVLCVNVLEHIDNDAAAVSNMLRLLNPGGHLLLFVPAFPVLFSNLDAIGGHFRRYSKNSLKRLATEESKILVARYFNSLGGVGWWINGHIGHESLNDDAVNTQIRFFDNYLVSIAKKLDIVTRSFFGQSIIMVLKAK